MNISFQALRSFRDLNILSYLFFFPCKKFLSDINPFMMHSFLLEHAFLL